MSNLFGILGHLLGGGQQAAGGNPNGYNPNAVQYQGSGYVPLAQAPQPGPNNTQQNGQKQNLLAQAGRGMASALFPQHQQQPPAQLQQSNQPMYMSYDGYLTGPPTASASADSGGGGTGFNGGDD